jgi:hypothetical protein
MSTIQQMQETANGHSLLFIVAARTVVSTRSLAAIVAMLPSPSETSWTS